jgi:putative hydrolase of the HAD superfamily
MIKAIIFDCFGVLASDGWLPFKNKYFGEDDRLFNKASELNRKSDAGLLSYEQFLREVAKLAGISEDKARYYIEHNVPDEKIFEYISQLKKNYKIGMLSNASGYWLDQIFTPKQVELFDEVSLSFETGHIKPEPEAYQSILDKLAVSAGEAVFIDDQARYCDGAKAIGLRSILYENYPKLKSELDKVLAAGPDN